MSHYWAYTDTRYSKSAVAITEYKRILLSPFIDDMTALASLANVSCQGWNFNQCQKPGNQEMHLSVWDLSAISNSNWETLSNSW